MADIGNSGRAILEGDDIVIRVPKSVLHTVVEGSWAAGGMDIRLKVTDADLFARELIRELNDEDETGATPIDRMFDKAIAQASEQGAQGIEEHGDQEP
jgi:hypothetical protein